MENNSCTEYIPLNDVSAQVNKPLPQLKPWALVKLKKSHFIAVCNRKVPELPRWMRFSGWRATVITGAGVSLFVLVLNIVLLIWASLQPKDPQTGAAIIYSGSSNSAQVFFTWSHLVLNVLSTVLLGCSNATMQCLIAPTREEVDRAHAKGQWLDIGISGFQNWSAISRWRRILWICLALSSVPFHLIYNSAIFSTTSVSEYYAVITTQDFLQNSTFSVEPIDGVPMPDSPLIQNISNAISDLQNRAMSGGLHRLENSDCIQQYSAPLNTQYSNLAVVTNMSHYNYSEWRNGEESPLTNKTGSVISYNIVGPYDDSKFVEKYTSSSWICEEIGNMPCSWSQLIDQANIWNFTHIYFFNSSTGYWLPSYPVVVDYCLAQPFSSTSDVELDQGIVITVIIFNAIHAVCLFYVIRKKAFAPLVTLGDGLASFLARPDEHTRGTGPLSASDVRASKTFFQLLRSRDWRLQRYSPSNQQVRAIHNDCQRQVIIQKLLPSTASTWKDNKRRWFSGASKIRWTLTYLVCLALWVAAWNILTITYLDNFSGEDSLAALWNNGFGNLSPQSTIGSTQGLSILTNVLIANSPQLVVSVAYVSFNGLLTCLVLSREFTVFVRKRQGLRVTNPQGKYQRSTYWLSLPYRFSLPLLGLSAAFHWILSQTMFLIEVRVYMPNGVLDPDPENSISVVDWSALSLIITIGLAGILMLVPLIVGFSRYDSKIPIVESCSLAISAACHPSDRRNEADSLLKYGVASENGDELVGLSSRTVSDLTSDRKYGSRLCIEELAAEHLPPLPPVLHRTKQSVESLLFSLQFLKFSLATIVAIMMGNLTACSGYPTIADASTVGLRAFALLVACLTATLPWMRKLLPNFSTRSVITIWDALVETFVLFCWAFVFVFVDIHLGGFPVSVLCPYMPGIEIMLELVAFLVSCPAKWYLWKTYGRLPSPDTIDHTTIQS